MKCVSWNVNGIRAVERKELLPWQQMDADVFCLQETKAQESQLSEGVISPDGFVSSFFSAEKKGYSGVAIYSKKTPDEVILGIDNEEYDNEGRVISALFGDVLIVNAYFPNSQEGGKRLDYKLGFCDALKDFMDSFVNAGKTVVLFGDYNIAHTEIDLKNPKTNHKNPGFLPEEREWMTSFLDGGYHDVFREENPDKEGAYTWWSYRFGARAKGIGWRIDYVTVNSASRDCVSSAVIRDDILGSDHCPISVEID